MLAFWGGLGSVPAVLCIFFLGDMEAAVHYAAEFRRLAKLVAGSISLAAIYQLETLACIALYRQTRKRHLVVVARRNARLLANLAKKAPDFCLGKSFLLKAELGSLKAMKKKKKNTNKTIVDDTVLHHYKCAVSLAGSYKILSDEAVACELTGRYLVRDCQNESEGLYYIGKACEVYQQWGSEIRGEQLAEEFANMRVKAANWR